MILCNKTYHRHILKIQYVLDKWSLHGSEKNGSIYRMFHSSDFWETGQLRLKKRKSEKRNEKTSFTSLIPDILLISETKFDGIFPSSQFVISGYSNIYQLDGNDKGEGIMFSVKDNLITFPVSGFCSSKKQIFCVELTLRKQKWLIFCCYNPYKHLIKDRWPHFKNVIDFYSESYENVILIGDFNAEIVIST